MKWFNVKANDPCRICGKNSWCRYSEDWIICQRSDTGEGIEKQDKNGAYYWLYPTSETRSKQSTSNEQPDTHDDAPKLATADTLHRVYTALLAEFNLSDRHRENLEKRGLSEKTINRFLYRSMLTTGRAKIARLLAERFGDAALRSVPGFYVKEQEGKRWWSIAGKSGILIPVRDGKGRIIALKIRQDSTTEGGNRYRWLSSKSHNGASPGSPPHVPLFEGDTNTVRLTEGELKADVTTALSGILTISAPGVGNWRMTIPVLEAIKPQKVLLAFDADARRKLPVAESLKSVFFALQKAGFSTSLELWPEEEGKGIDDLLQAGGKPSIFSGHDAEREIFRIIHEAGGSDYPGEINIGDAFDLDEEAQKTPTPILSIEEARERMQEILSAQNSLIKSGKRTVIRATPGIGKTMMSLRETVKPLIERGLGILFCIGTRQGVTDIVNRAHKEAGIPRYLTERIDGRRGGEHGNCPQAESCYTVAQKGYGVTSVVCKNCEFNPSNIFKTGKEACGYLKQFSRLWRIKKMQDEREKKGEIAPGLFIVTTYDSALRLLSEKSNRFPEIALVICDEKPTRPLIQADVFRRDEAQAGNAPEELIAFRCFLDKILDRAEKRSKEDKKREVNRDDKLKQFIKRMARNSFPGGEEELKGLLEKVSSLSVEIQPVKSQKDADALPNKRLIDLARGIKDLQDDVTHPRVTLYRSENGTRLMLNTVTPWLRETPVLFLDAYGDPWMYEQFFGGHIETHRIDVRFPEKVDIRIIKTATSRKSLFGDAFFQKADKHLAPMIENHRGEKVLIYVHKRFRYKLGVWIKGRGGTLIDNTEREIYRYPDETQVALKHFGEDRGDDFFRDYDAVSLFGTPYPNVEPIADLLSAILAATGDDIPIDRRVKGKFHTPIDLRLRRLIEAEREQEMMQAIYRLRPCSAKKPKSIVIFSTLDMSRYLPQAIRENPRKTAPWHSELPIFIRQMIQKCGYWTDDMLPETAPKGLSRQRPYIKLRGEILAETPMSKTDRGKCVWGDFSRYLSDYRLSTKKPLKSTRPVSFSKSRNSSILYRKAMDVAKLKGNFAKTCTSTDARYFLVDVRGKASPKIYREKECYSCGGHIFYGNPDYPVCELCHPSYILRDDETEEIPIDSKTFIAIPLTADPYEGGECPTCSCSIRYGADERCAVCTPPQLPDDLKTAVVIEVSQAALPPFKHPIARCSECGGHTVWLPDRRYRAVMNCDKCEPYESHADLSRKIIGEIFAPRGHSLTDDREQFEERAAIFEYEARMPRALAETKAREYLKNQRIKKIWGNDLGRKATASSGKS